MKHEPHRHQHHDDACSCGHDHGNHPKHPDHQNHDAHHHDNAPCSCGHDHEKPPHDHPQDFIPHHDDRTITHHENAVIISAEREIPGDYAKIKADLATGLKELAGWVESQNGLVGHIKAHLLQNGPSAMLSTTGDDVQIKETDQTSVLVNLAVIVFVENEAGLAEQVSQLLKDTETKSC